MSTPSFANAATEQPRLSSSPPPKLSQSHSSAAGTMYISTSSPTINFAASKQASGYVSRITINNRLFDRAVAFKLKTNAPQRYSVKPVYGLIHPDKPVDIYIRCDSEIHINDKFMVQTIPVPQEQLTITSDFWRSVDAKEARVDYMECRYSQRRRLSSFRKSSVSSRESSPGAGYLSTDESSSISSVTRRPGMQTARSSLVNTTALRTSAALSESKKRKDAEQQRSFMRKIFLLAIFGALIAIYWTGLFSSRKIHESIAISREDNQ